MAAMLTITGLQREALRDLMVYRLLVIGDRRLEAALAEGTPHERLAAEFGEDLRLMQDLDWDLRKRGDVVLTVRRAPLELTLRRMRLDAVEAQTEDVQPQRPIETKEERMARFKLAEQTCDELLPALG